MKILKRILILAIPLAVYIFLNGCEQDITLDMPQGKPKLVVEGYIEPGMPPYVILTSSQAYFSNSSITDIKGIFVHGADVRVSDGTDTVKLFEVVMNNLPDSLIKQISDLMGIKLTKEQLKDIDYSFYTTLAMTGAGGKTYRLWIDSGQHHLQSLTKLPVPVAPDSVWAIAHPDPKNDSLVQLRFKLTDPASEVNYYRYFTKRNSEPFYPFRFASLTDDKFFNGKEVTWTLQRGDDPYSEIDPVTFTYFWKGDTITLKYCSIDKACYDFWRTKEDDAGSGGPFSSPVLVKTNIIGGLGIWCGYGSSYTTFVVPK